MMARDFQIKRHENTRTDEDSESFNWNEEIKNSEFVSLGKGVSLLSVSILLITSMAISTLVGVYMGRSINPNKSLHSIYKGEYSPLINDIDITYETVRFNGSLFKENVFRHAAGAEVDAAWDSLGVDYRSAIIPSSFAEKYGLLPSHVQVSPKYGGGYPANVEGLHHLHCLNLLRKSLYYNYEYYHTLGKGAFKNNDTVVRSHVGHCLDILRQRLMCQPEIGVLGQIWYNKAKPQAYPDFNTLHKCKNYESIRQWAEEHQAPVNVAGDYLAAPAKEDVLESIP